MLWLLAHFPCGMGGLAMMGPRQVAQGALFYEFSIEDHVPPEHLLRSIDRFVDLGDMRRYLAPFYSSTGRPSVDPRADDPNADRWLSSARVHWAAGSNFATIFGCDSEAAPKTASSSVSRYSAQRTRSAATNFDYVGVSDTPRRSFGIKRRSSLVSAKVHSFAVCHPVQQARR